MPRDGKRRSTLSTCYERISSCRFAELAQRADGDEPNVAAVCDLDDHSALRLCP